MQPFISLKRSPQGFYVCIKNELTHCIFLVYEHSISLLTDAWIPSSLHQLLPV